MVALWIQNQRLRPLLNLQGVSDWGSFCAVGHIHLVVPLADDFGFRCWCECLPVWGAPGQGLDPISWTFLRLDQRFVCSSHSASTTQRQ